MTASEGETMFPEPGDSGRHRTGAGSRGGSHLPPTLQHQSREEQEDNPTSSLLPRSGSCPSLPLAEPDWKPEAKEPK